MDISMDISIDIDALVQELRRLGDIFYEMGVRLGMRDYRAEHEHQRQYRRKQQQLRAHVYRQCAGNRRRHRR